MKPPPSTVQGRPAYKLNGMKYKADLWDGARGIAPENDALIGELKLDKVMNEEIPSPMKSIGINTNPYDILPGCREVNDLHKVNRGNGISFDTNPLNPVDHRPLDGSVFTADRIGLGFDPKQQAFGTSTYFRTPA